MSTPAPPTPGIPATPSILQQVSAAFHFPSTTPLTEHQLHILHTVHQHLPVINHMRRGFAAMSRPPTTPTPTLTAPPHPRVLWARKLAISLSNIQIALCGFCMFREDKSGGDVGLLVEILEPVKVWLDVLVGRYQEMQAEMGVERTQVFSFAVTGTEAHLRAVMRVAGCWWEDVYLAGRGVRGVGAGALADGRAVKEESVVSDDRTVKAESVVSDDRTVVEGSAVSDDRTVSESSAGVETRGGSVWSAGAETGSVTTGCGEHGKNVSAAGSSAGGRRSASTAGNAHNDHNASTRSSPEHDNTVVMTESSPEPDRDTASFTTGGAETEADTWSWATGSAEPEEPEPETEEDPWSESASDC
ncbi:uncharacterized protein H6S33_010836 [Morchella sextelata]|uniref:uncharacterized protein n=1 Tax=Morchella sextelata TaxID=1174677 RepID=UPI001D04CB11|nr:uncharacterized protein H6S33_010836 [Morchella sextelata]KAH0611571.1 hypothetical protein H6S33_010836 [Morchella sextelata]